MKADDNMFRFEPMEVDESASIHSIRLIESKGQVQLLAAVTQQRSAGFPEYETVIWAMPVDQRPPRRSKLMALSQLLPPPPRWDAVTAADGSIAIGAESAGGAIYSLFVQTAQGSPRTVTGRYPLDSFTYPRFLKRRRSPNDATVSAVLESRHLVVFPGRLSSPHGEYHQIVEAVDGLLIENPKGFELFYKTSRPGISRGDVPPGEILAAELAREFGPPSRPESPLRAENVFEFDADLAGEYLALFVTAENDMILTRRLATGGSFKRVRLEGKYDGAQLRHPCVLASKTHVYLAVLEAPGTPAARVLTARAVLEAMR